jgi:hypothetical protein
MSSSDEEKKPIENKFIETIEKVFEEDRWDDIKTLLNKVREKRGKAEDGCGKYGDDSTTIELMLYIRKLMREEKLISSVPLENYIQSQPLTIENLKKFVVLDGKTRSWLTARYKKEYPISYDSEPESHSWDYFDDGWDYSKYLEENSLDADTEWFFEFKDRFGHKVRLSHIYYNELDHYLTYLVYAIRTNKTCDRSKKGVNIKKDLKNK